MNKTFDYLVAGGSCGIPGQQAGLSIAFSQSVITKIPYRVKIEVPFYVTTIGTTCLDYDNIQLIFFATCENVNTYQYGIIFDDKSGDVTVDYDTTYGVSNSTALFSVKWKAPRAIAATYSSNTAFSGQSLQSFNEIRNFFQRLLCFNYIGI